MKITPLEIRQKTFEKNFRGFDKDEVSSFLVSLSQEWEREMDEKRALQIRLEQVEKETAKLREVEDSLFKTLKAAEDTGASMIEQANKTAELILKESQMNADAMIAEAKNKSRSIIEEAESNAKRIVEDLKGEVKNLVGNYEELLAQREMVIRNLKNLATESLENVKQSQEDIKRIDLEIHTKAVKELSRSVSQYGGEMELKQPKEKSHSFVIESKKEAEPVKIEEKAEQLSEKIQAEEKETQAIEEQSAEDKAVSKETIPFKESPSPEVIKEDKPKEDPGAPKKASGSFFDQFD